MVEANQSEVVISDLSVCVPIDTVGEGVTDRQTVMVSDFSVCQPGIYVSTEPQVPGIWQLLDYEAGEVKGIALFGTQNTRAQPVVVPLREQNLRGWYEIRYGMWDVSGPSHRPPGEGLRAKLTDDPAWSVWRSDMQVKRAEVVEHVWKIADLTGQDLHLAQIPWMKDLTLRGLLAWVKLIPIPTPTGVNTHTDTWRLTEYQASESGTAPGIAIEADEDCLGCEAILHLEDRSLSGWYDIYAALYDPGSPYDRYFYNGLDMKLTDDLSFYYLSLYSPIIPHVTKPFPARRGLLRERFWKRAKLDGQNIHLRQTRSTDEFRHGYKPDYAPFNVRCGVGWVRLVQVEPPAQPSAAARPAKPRLIQWSDLQHGQVNTEGEVRVQLDWLRAEPYNTFLLDINGAPDKTRYPTRIGRSMDKYEVVLRYLDSRMIETNAKMIRNGVNCLAVWADEARKLGLDFWIFFRLGAWGYAQPWQVFGGPFFKEHPECLAVDKDGSLWHTMSYAFPAVREYMVDLYQEVIEISRSEGGKCDGIVLGFCRGPIFLGYEPHVCEAFEEEFGDDPRQLPDEDARWLKFRARYLTILLEDLRPMVDQESAKQGGNIQLVADAYGHEAINLRFGLDVRDWVEKGLPNVIQVHGNFAGGAFDREFYKEIKALGKGVEIIISGLDVLEFEQWKKEYLKDFDGLAMDGPLSPRGFDETHPIKREGNLSLGTSSPPISRTPAPGQITGKSRVDRIQRLNIGKPFYAAGL